MDTVRTQSRFMTHDVKHERCFASHASTTTVSSQSQQQAHERSEQPAHTLSSRGIRPAVRITATAPAGSTHPGASTEPGSATPLLASSGTTEVCSTVVTAERAAGRGDAIIVVQEAPARPPAVVMRALGGATTKASATGARHRRGSTAESFMALVLLCFEHTFSSLCKHLSIDRRRCSIVVGRLVLRAGMRDKVSANQNEKTKNHTTLVCCVLWWCCLCCHLTPVS